MLLQRRTPDRVNLAAAAAAKAAGVPIVVDAGGVDAPIPAALLEAADYLCPNESELARLTRMPTSTDDEAVAAGLELVARGANRVLVTLGARGAMVIGATGVLVRHDALPVPGGEVGKIGEVVDGTAAGDAFRAAPRRRRGGRRRREGFPGFGAGRCGGGARGERPGRCAVASHA